MMQGRMAICLPWTMFAVGTGFKLALSDAYFPGFEAVMLVRL